MEADFYIHRGGWGDCVEWSNEDFSHVNLNTDTIGVIGHMPTRPKIGDTLIGEFEKSFIKFEFVSVKYPEKPPDMFFGEVKAIEQELKDDL